MSQTLVSGIALGLLYGLIGIGFQVMARGSRIFNFAHGELVALGALTYATLATFSFTAGFELVLILLTGVAMALVALFLHSTIFQWARRLDELGVAIVTIGVAIVIQGVMIEFWGQNPHFAPSAWPWGAVRLESPSLVISGAQLMLLVGSVTLLLLVYAYFNRGATGREILAMADDRDAARLAGISPRRVDLLVFGGAGLIAGLTGALVAPVTFAAAGTGFNFTLKGFSATMVGGMDENLGPLVGGLIVGLLEVVVARYISSGLRDVIVLSIVIVIIMARPVGVLGTEKVRIT